MDRNDFWLDFNYGLSCLISECKYAKADKSLSPLGVIFQSKLGAAIGHVLPCQFTGSITNVRVDNTLIRSDYLLQTGH